MSESLYIIAAAAAALFFLYRRSLRYLQFYQQEEYNGKRFLSWYLKYRAFDTRGSIVCAVMLGIAMFASGAIRDVAWGAGVLGLVVLAFYEPDPRLSGKIPLKLTARARRIWYLALGILALAVVLAVILWLGAGFAAGFFWLFLLVLFQVGPASMVLSNILLAPYEKKLQQSFIDEAKSILARVDPRVIGITGSYGKTSTKAILGSFMETLGPTIWPSRSINTQMGIVRDIRERLVPGFRFAIIEMGAYGIGSIEKLCDLARPSVGVITNIGIMHLERFGSPDAVYRAKSELARALPEDGLLICNGDDPGARRVAKEYPAKETILYGFDGEDLDCRMLDIRATEQGTEFEIHWRGEDYSGSTGLLGRPMLSNLLAAFATACALGANPAALLAAARNLSPQAHRMELRREGDILTIDDAYNSNPVGFAAALEVLRDLPGGRKILITPGMVELGDMQAGENKRLATMAAGIADLVLIVGDTNAEAIKQGLRESGNERLLVQEFDHRDKARAWFDAQVQAGDVVLWENDLPDLYEDIPRF